MKRIMFGLVVLSFLLFGCSSHEARDSESSYDMSVSEGGMIESDISIGSTGSLPIDPIEPTAPDLKQLENVNRRIIYNAYLELEVKQYLEVVSSIEQTVNEMNGYVVSNQTSRFDDELHYGHLTLRIPQESLNLFFDFLDGHDQIYIQHRDLVGEDVTEQYVDLETRLKSRQELEARLLAFMEEAKSTEDLLNISRDLSNVQYEIEMIKGQMNYINNRADLATVELNLTELQTEFAHEQNLNVWERTKEQWLISYNNLLIGATNLFVFIVGNLPILIVIAAIGGLIYFGYRRKNNRNTSE